MSPVIDDENRFPPIHVQQEFEFAPDALLVTDRHGLILKANQAAASMFQCPKEFLTGKPLGLFVAEGFRARFYDCLSRMWQGLSGDHFEIRMNSRNPTPRDVSVHVIVVNYGSERSESLYRWDIRDNSATKKVEAERQELLRRLATNQEEERRRISRELHDSIGQLLTAFSLAVKAAREAGGLTPAATARLVSVQQVADELGRAAHDLALRLRPTALDDLGLVPALSQYLREWSSRTGIPIEFESRGLDSPQKRLPAEIETAVFRIVQEALANVFRHSRAKIANIVIVLLDGQVSVVVEDDGIGFDVDAIGPGRLGLLGMEERAALAQGKLVIESSPGKGTTVIVRFPCK